MTAAYQWMSLWGASFIEAVLLAGAVCYLRAYRRGTKEEWTQMTTIWTSDPADPWHAPETGPVPGHLLADPANTIRWAGGSISYQDIEQMRAQLEEVLFPFGRPAKPLCCPLDSAGYGQHSTVEEAGQCLRRRAAYRAGKRTKLPGPPSSGTWQTGTRVRDRGTWWVCIAGGSPGIWATPPETKTLAGLAGLRDAWVTAGTMEALDAFLAGLAKVTSTAELDLLRPAPVAPARWWKRAVIRVLQAITSRRR